LEAGDFDAFEGAVVGGSLSCGDAGIAAGNAGFGVVEFVAFGFIDVAERGFFDAIFEEGGCEADDIAEAVGTFVDRAEAQGEFGGAVEAFEGFGIQHGAPGFAVGELLHKLSRRRTK